MRNLSGFLLLLLLIGCNQSSKQAYTTKVAPIIYQAGNGNRIVFLNDYYTDYINSLKAGAENHDSLFRKKIQSPCNTYFSKSEYAQYLSTLFYVPDTTNLDERISEINNNLDKIEKIISSALVECRKYLKNDSITICIQPYANVGGYADTIIKIRGGNTGLTVGSKEILLTIDPSVISWRNMLGETLVHEYNHAYWIKMHFSEEDERNILLDLINEGKADSYAHFIYPSIIPIWDTILPNKEKIAFWNRLKPKLNNTDLNMYRKVMFGDRSDLTNYPIWGGYCLGYSIVQSALKNNPSLTPQEWSNLSPEKILEMSDYK